MQKSRGKASRKFKCSKAEMCLCFQDPARRPVQGEPSGEKGTLLHCWWECKLVQPLWRTVWRFLKKLKMELPYDPAIPLLGLYPEKTII